MAQVINVKTVDFHGMVDRMVNIESVAEIVGANAKRLRLAAGASAETLATAIRHHGMKWDASRVSALEKGRVSPTVPTLFVLAQALDALSRGPVSVGDLLAGDGYAEIGSTAILTERIAQAFDGGPITLRVRDVLDGTDRLRSAMRQTSATLRGLPESLQSVDVEALAAAEEGRSDAERKIATTLGVPAAHVIAASALLWGSSFTAERDRRAGVGANAQKRGIASRAMRSEIEEVLRGND